MKYPWQQAVVDAIVEFRPERLPGKIKTAERAIAARLCDPQEPDLDEHLTLANALLALRVIDSPRRDARDQREPCHNKIA